MNRYRYPTYERPRKFIYKFAPGDKIRIQFDWGTENSCSIIGVGEYVLDVGQFYLVSRDYESLSVMQVLEDFIHEQI